MAFKNVAVESCEHRRSINPHSHLTEREIEIVKHIRQAEKNSKIAFELGISEQTVKNHINHIFIKLSCDNRTGIAMKTNEMFFNDFGLNI